MPPAPPQTHHSDAEADRAGKMVTATALGYNGTKQRLADSGIAEWIGRGCLR